MSKKYNTVYVLELRKQKYKSSFIPNRIYNIIGIFTTEKLAKKWLTKNKKEYFSSNMSCKKKNKYFFVITEFAIDAIEEDSYIRIACYGLHI